MTIEDALRIAIDAHGGQKDLDGKPVILHPLAVGLSGRNEIEQKVGFLHDVVEDSGITLQDLSARGLEEEALVALSLCTCRKGQSYSDYVGQIASSGNQTAIQVKLHDLRHNLERGRKSQTAAFAAGDQEKGKEMLRINNKHQEALETILAKVRLEMNE
ncbi:MAG: hypothetical protein QM324_09690 [Bacteroidota bacterium]|nr:hypothetical protein [Bacteroidota bacterium]